MRERTHVIGLHRQASQETLINEKSKHRNVPRSPLNSRNPQTGPSLQYRVSRSYPFRRVQPPFERTGIKASVLKSSTQISCLSYPTHTQLVPRRSTSFTPREIVQAPTQSSEKIGIRSSLRLILREFPVDLRVRHRS